MDIKDIFKKNKSYTFEKIKKKVTWLEFDELIKELNELVKTNYLTLKNGRYQLNDIEQVINEVEEEEFINSEITEEDVFKKHLAICEIINGQLVIKDSDYILKTKDNCFDKLVNGDIVIVRLKKEHECNIVERIGHIDDPNIDLKVIAISKQFKIDFYKDSLKQLEQISTSVTDDELINRLDLRDELIYTIDGADTKDMDDAISVKILENGNYELGVHIADVAHYVPINTPLSNEAFERGNSLYLIDKVIPMLPHQLSNGICSLNPNVDRLTISCIMEIDKNGDIVDYKIVESVINSKKKMTYEDVDRILMDNEIVQGYEEYIDNLKLCNELSFLLSKNYNEGGYLHFKSDELKVKVDENGFPLKFEPIVTRAGRKIIENFMLAANKTVAQHFAYVPFCFRTHDKPESESLEKVLEILDKMGYHVSYVNIDRFKLHELFRHLYESGNYSVISPQILKAMKRANYSDENIGHFGLGFYYYTHFTSPIRRFNDLQVHYLIKMYNNPSISLKNINNMKKQLPLICEHINKKERLADEAEEEAVKLKMVQYMEKRVRKYFNGKIIGIGPKYIAIKLENGVVGKCYLEDLKGDRYHFDRDEYAIVGINHNQTFKLADYVRVNVLRADIKTKAINFRITENLEHVKTKTMTLK